MRPPGRRVARTVELADAGSAVGTESVFGLDAYLATARALDEVRCLAVSRPSFRRLADERPDLAVGVLQACGRSALQTVQRSAILTHAPVEVALRRLLQDLGRRRQEDRGGPVRITRAQLAGVLHVSRETVSRVLNRLASQGVVELGRGRIRPRPH